MAYSTITPKTSMPADNAAGVELRGYDSAEVFLKCSAGSGTACLIQKGPGGIWHQRGPSWTVDATTAGQQVGRISIPWDAWEYQILITGGPTIDSAYLVGVNHGR